MNFLYTKVAYASLDSFISNVNQMIINPLIVFLFAVALVFFLYGVFGFIANAQNDEKRTTGKSHMLWGVVGMAIMIGVFGILNILLSTFNITEVDPQSGTVQLPY